jgi:replicative DNA helicase
MNSSSSSPISKLVSSIQIWDESIYERIYLGWCLAHLDSKLLQEALSFVDETWFYDHNRKTIYTSIVQAALEVSIETGLRIKVERISSAAQLLSDERSQWADRCIESCLEAERQTMFSIDSLDAICIAQWRVVRAKPAVEKLILKVDELLATKGSVEELPIKVEAALHEASETWSNSIHQVNKKGEVTESQFIDELLEELDESNPIVAPSSMEAFDSHLLGGVAINTNTICGKLVTIAARPGVGKTATAISIVKGIASNGYKGVFYTLEVPKRQMLQRLLCIHDFTYQLRTKGQLVNCIKMNQVSKRNFTEDQVDRINSYRGSISKNIEIFDSFREVKQISSHLKMLKKRDPSIAVACIDHLGLMRLPKNENTAHAIGDITTSLKQLAVELSMDILLMCQLNREVEKRNNKRPVLSDLRDSGRIEEDSDTVIGLYRDIDNDSQELELISLKNRHNGLGTTKCNFYLQYGTVK